MSWFLGGTLLPLMLCGLMCGAGGLVAAFGLRGMTKSAHRADRNRAADTAPRR